MRLRTLRYLLLLPIVAIGWLAPDSTMVDLDQKARTDVAADHGITDSRALHFQMTGLFRPNDFLEPPSPSLIRNVINTNASREIFLKWGRQIREVVVGRAVGLLGFYEGPHVHIIDMYALGDPLLSHLAPAHNIHIDHFRRPLPDGYLASIAAGKDEITDPHVRKEYEEVSLITRGKIFDKARLMAIIRVNTSGYVN